MINKKVNSVQEALQGVEDNMTIMLGGFGLCGIPENSIAELVKKETKTTKHDGHIVFNALQCLLYGIYFFVNHDF